jgi:NAD(P) transhydrogenase subunit alpha
MGPINLPASIPYHASQMYARNAVTFIQNMVKEGEVKVDVEDEIIRDTLVTSDGDVVNPRVREILGMSGASAA